MTQGRLEQIAPALRPLRDLSRRALDAWERWPPAAYLTLLLLQAKVTWGAWHHLDLSAGDTSGYYVYARLWATELLGSLAWSPLYTAFYGSMLAALGDVYAATVWHRLLIVFGAGAMVLALLRRLLPPGLAWLLAAWWALLPVNFATAYEVHLFALIPLLAAWVTALGWRGPWGRGATLGILLGASVLVRNEFALAALTFAGVCLAWEIRDARRVPGARRRVPLAAYAVPLLAVAAVCAGFYLRAVDRHPAILSSALRGKHTLNMCQAYAYGHRQRHADWQGDPWTQCGELMARLFGRPHPSLRDMLRANAPAVVEHALWNLRLTPSGLQLSLFNTMSSQVRPDYGEVASGPRFALRLSGAVLLVLLAGGVLLVRRQRRWWPELPGDRAVGWWAMLSTAPVWLLVILTQRPRPAYLFSLGVFLLALIGMSLVAMAGRWPWLGRLRAAPLVAAAVLLVATSPYYGSSGRPGSRPLLEIHRRLSPFQDVIASDDAMLLVDQFGLEIQHYLGLGHPQVVAYGALGAFPSRDAFRAVLAQRGVNLLYVDEVSMGRVAAFTPRPSVDAEAWKDWRVLGFEDQGDARWHLWARRAWAEESRGVFLLRRLNAERDIVPPDAVRALANAARPPADGLFCGYGWHGPQASRRRVYRWVDRDAEIVVTSPSGRRRRMVLDLEPGPAADSRPLEVRLVDSGGREVARATVRAREEVAFALPLEAGASRVFRLRLGQGGDPGVPPGREPAARVFRLAWADRP